MIRHKDFILSPITGILKEMVSANILIGSGIETYPMSEYVMQTVFLRMTGAQEQKVKCLGWELATIDYDYRYRRYSKGTPGEGSTYTDKQAIYKDLINAIRHHAPAFDIENENIGERVREETQSEINQLFLQSSLTNSSERPFRDYQQAWPLILDNHIARRNNLFENVLQEKYALLYSHRNRCAHNTFSYQENLPTLHSLVDDSQIFENYFIRFSLLIMIDKILMFLYERYLNLIDENFI